MLVCGWKCVMNTLDAHIIHKINLLIFCCGFRYENIFIGTLSGFLVRIICKRPHGVILRVCLIIYLKHRDIFNTEQLFLSFSNFKTLLIQVFVKYGMNIFMMIVNM